MEGSTLAVISFLIFTFSMVLSFSIYIINFVFEGFSEDRRYNTREQTVEEIIMYSALALGVLTYWPAMLLISSMTLLGKTVVFGFLLFFGVVSIFYRIPPEPF